MTPNFRAIICAVVSAAVLLALIPAQAQTGGSQETLNQYIADLQKNPDDNAIREKIIKLAQEMKPAPKIPNEVDELIGKATYIFKNAKSEAEFNDAVDAYQKALLIVPWVPEYYYNLGTVQEKAGKFKEAINSLNLYLLAVPEAKDAKEVREHIGGLKYAAEKVAKATSSEAAAAQEQNKSEDWLKKLDGRKYWYRDAVGNEHILDVRGKVLVWIVPGSRSPEWGRFEIRGREFTYPSPLRPDEEFTFIISDDGNRITERVIRHSDGAKAEYIYLWQR